MTKDEFDNLTYGATCTVKWGLNKGRVVKVVFFMENDRVLVYGDNCRPLRTIKGYTVDGVIYGRRQLNIAIQKNGAP